MIVWLVEAIKNLYPCIVLNPISLSYAFYCEIDPYYPLQNTTGNYFQYTHCYWQLISLNMVAFVDHLLLGLIFTGLFYFQEIFVAPVVFLAFLKMFLIPIKFTLMEDKPFLLVLCVIVKSVESLAYLLEPCSFWECIISFLLTCFICFNEINLWACVALSIFYAQ